MVLVCMVLVNAWFWYARFGKWVWTGLVYGVVIMLNTKLEWTCLATISYNRTQISSGSTHIHSSLPKHHPLRTNYGLHKVTFNTTLSNNTINTYKKWMMCIKQNHHNHITLNPAQNNITLNPKQHHLKSSL
jgi:hypothetical protein